MTAAQLRASIARHSRFLSPVQSNELLATEAELLAADRSYAIAKQSGALFREEDRRALQRPDQ